MNVRRFFTSQNWWGKLLGAFLGYLMAGPVGSLFGILIGNFFDRGLNEHFANPAWQYHAERRPNVKKIFFQTTFSVMGHISKADGRISEQEIQATKAFMHEMNLNKEQRAAAQFYFNEGKKEHFQLVPALKMLHKAAFNNPGLLKLFITMQYNLAQIDGLSEKKIQLMNTILTQMNYAPIQEQSRFNDDFYQYQQRQRQQHQYSSYSRRGESTTQTGHILDQAYAILKILPTSSKQDVKRAYRRLISQNHPDKLSAQGLSKERIKEANEKTHIIRKAYEQICASKGW